MNEEFNMESNKNCDMFHFKITKEYNLHKHFGLKHSFLYSLNHLYMYANHLRVEDKQDLY